MSKRPIIVIKKKITHASHHGGAWKVAYADFVTAMMSLFIVLWLLNSTPQVKKSIAGYFNDPKGVAEMTGSDKLGSGDTLTIDDKSAEKLKERIERAILKQKDLEQIAKQVEITVTGEGLRIELLEDKGGTFFESGSATLSHAGVKLLGIIAAQLRSLPNHLLIEGHTDAQPYAVDQQYTNWELSSDRANSARRLLQVSGVGAKQIAQVRGYGDQLLRVPKNPLDPSNRRVSVIVQWLDAPLAAPAPPAKELASEKKEAAPPPVKVAEATVAPVAKPSAAIAKPGLIAKLERLIPHRGGR